MKDRIARQAWRIGLATALLPFAAGSVGQSGLNWRDVAPAASQPVPQQPVPQQPVSYQPSAVPAPAYPVPVQARPFDVRHFEAMAQQLVAGGRIPGLAVAIVQNGRVLSARGYGVTDSRAGQPVDAHTVFRIASLSKSFAGTVTGMLVNDGLLRWDSRLVDYLPDFRLSQPAAAQQVTITDLLAHRVGLSRNAYDRDLEANAEFHSLTRKLATAPLTCSPGQCYAYQNVAFSLVGDVVFAATGQFFSEAVARRIFKPLGMHDASYGLDGIQASARWARPHVRGGGGWVPLTPKPTYYRVAPAAGVNASISDMAQWLLAQTGHRPDVLPASLLATLHAPVIATPAELRGSAWRRSRLTSASYGLGWRVFDYAGHDVVFHGGAVQGYRGAMALLPDRNLGIAILWNSESALPSGLLPTVLDSALGISGGQWLDPAIAEGDLYSTSLEGAGGADATAAGAAPR